jgi:intein/homing endonuclease
MILPGMALHKRQMECFADRHRFKCVVSGRRWGKCLDKDTRIAMSDGTWREISKIQPGDKVETVNEDTYAIESREVTGLLSNGVRETIEITSSGRKVRCTPNHPFLINNRWVEAQHIKVGDLIAVPKSLPVFADIHKPDNEIDMLAIWLAEGNGYIISNTTSEILETIDQAILPWGLHRKSQNGVDWMITDGLKNTGVARNKMVLLLKEWKVWGCNSKTKYIPEWVYQLPYRQLARFLNLFIACDGSINRRSNKTWAVEIGLANERMVRQLAELFLKFGIRGQISHKIHTARGKDGKNFESWRFIASDSQAIIRFGEQIGALSKERQVDDALASARASAGSSNSYLPISHDEMIADHLVYADQPSRWESRATSRVPLNAPTDLKGVLNSWRKQSPERISTRRYEQLRSWTDGFFDPLADGDICWEEVTQIKEAGKSETFDLSITGNANFFANGFSSHNTKLGMAELLRAASKPRQLVWYVAPTYRMAKQIMWVDLLETIPKEFIFKSNETRLEITLINKSRIELKGADKPDTLRGVGINFLVIDEVQDVKEEVWKVVLRPTLASTRGRALFTGTPKAFNFLHELYMLGQKGEFLVNKAGKKIQNAWKSWQFPTITSPFIPLSEIEAARADMDERSFKQEFEATFESMSGRAYYQFDRALHVGDYAFNPKLPIWIGQDFNIDPMSSVIIQRQPSGELWVVDEIYLHNSNTTAVCDEIEKRYWRQTRQITIYPDPAGANRSTGRGESDLDIFRDRGIMRIRYRKKHPPQADRVNAVNKMLRSADGTVHLKVNNSCKNLIASLEQTLFKPNSYEIDKRLNIEHITDALGYPIELEYPRRRFEPAGLSI